jgi:hypothetical protein
MSCKMGEYPLVPDVSSTYLHKNRTTDTTNLFSGSLGVCNETRVYNETPSLQRIVMKGIWHNYRQTSVTQHTTNVNSCSTQETLNT